MAKVSGNEINAKFLEKLDEKINGLYSPDGTTMSSDLSEVLVGNEKKYVLKGNLFYYNQLKELKNLLTFSEVDELEVLKYKYIAFKRTDEKKFKDVLNSCKFFRDDFVQALLEFNSVGYLPGLNNSVLAPLPRMEGQSIASYEKYLKDYYASYNIRVGIDEETGVRKPYPHEVCQWENGVPRQAEKNFRNQYYRDLVETSKNKDNENEVSNADLSQDSVSNTNTRSNGPVRKAKFKVKNKQSYESFARRAGNFIMDAPDKLRNLDQKVGKDEFWANASKGIKRTALIALGGLLGGGLLFGLGSQFIGSFSTPGWVALGTGAASSLSAGSVILGVASSVAPIIGVATLVVLYAKLRQRHVKRRKAAEELNEKPDLNQVIQDEIPSLGETIANENSLSHDNSLGNGNSTVDNSISTPTPVVEQPTVSTPVQPAPTVVNEPVQNVANADFTQDPFLQLDSLMQMIKNDRDILDGLDARRITVESNGSPDAEALLNDINDKTRLAREQIKGNLRNIADLCMSYNQQYDNVNDLSEGGMKL